MSDPRPTTVVQIAPEIAAGSGVGGVAYHLEQAWQAVGVPTERFTMAEAAGSWLPEPGAGLWGKVVLGLRVVWFSTIGTLLARRYLARRPGVVAVCHNDVLVGDVYINHGILRAAMQARGHYALRMARNPMHLFTAVRDRWRYRRPTHRVVVSLTEQDARLLDQAYPGVAERSVVIGNGVDVDRYHPVPPSERARHRATLGLDPGIPTDAICLVFVGHEFDRKGLPLAIEALRGGPADLHLLVVGGTADLLAGARALADRCGVADRVHLVGRRDDPRPALWAADAFVLPTAYESFGLVVLEALACGLPVLVTPTGCAPDVVVDGRNGWLVDRTVPALRQGYADLVAADRSALATAARESALPYDWPAVAEAYLELLGTLQPADGPR